jgi:hypothetical protein
MLDAQAKNHRVPRLDPSATEQTANQPRAANMVSQNEALTKDQADPRGVTARTADIKLTGNPLLELDQTVAPSTRGVWSDYSRRTDWQLAND